jgi:hypothetical protein
VIVLIGGGFALTRGATESGFSAWVGQRLAETAANVSVGLLVSPRYPTARGLSSPTVKDSSRANLAVVLSWVSTCGFQTRQAWSQRDGLPSRVCCAVEGLRGPFAEAHPQPRSSGLARKRNAEFSIFRGERSRSRPEPNSVARARPLSAVKARPGTGAPPELTRTGVWSQVPCLAAAVALCTEFTANVVLGLLAHTAGALQLEPLQLMVPATLGCSFAFMLPVATPPNAIAFATGWIPLRDMLQRGLVMNVVGVGLVAVLMPLLGQCRKASSRRSKLELLTSGNGRLATLPFP